MGEEEEEEEEEEGEKEKNKKKKKKKKVPVYDQQTALAGAKTVVNADKATPTSFAQCLVDIKDLTKSLFKAIKRIMTMQDSCEDGSHHCVHNTLKLVASIGAMGEYL